MTERPVLITDAKESYQQQLSRRRKRYTLTMSMRIPFLIAAVLCIGTPWLALTLILLSVPLPWIAVLIANDGPARTQKAKKVLPGTISYDRAIETHHEVIDAPATDDHRTPTAS
ncbi:DUF3099 domain-containing protein [Nakamurella deserti]|uniref:DUF3099 domain-containing protein n=1 Tax=Nakamurella deserti TaxID=2164074 RepID=UPI000DBEA867|nr:DUF3099 domain-containing protein [Nakamurella deserti]